MTEFLGTEVPCADTFLVGESAISHITRMRRPTLEGEEPSRALFAGDVLRRTCSFAGDAVCQSICQAPTGYENTDKQCADQNLLEATEALNIVPRELLMVGVTADNVGFYDQLKDDEKITENSVGIRELKGYNAFFARSSEEVVLGARLADCGFAAITLKDQNNEEVFGFVHLTRPNLQGETAFKFSVNEEPAGCFKYFLNEALNYYGADIESVRVRVTAAIDGKNYQHVFNKDKGPEDLFPGWAEQGLLRNLCDPNWYPGQEYVAEDLWQPEYRKMVEWQILESGVQPDQLILDDMIDPANLELGHASNRAGKHGKMPDGRDLYVVGPRKK